MRALTFALALAVVAGCDSAPYPAPTNPFDPAFPSGRRVSAPTALEVVATTATSVTLAWPDPSSFETGFRVEVAEGEDGPFRPTPTYRPVATLPPDATGYTADGLLGSVPLAFRVVALGEGGDASAPSPEVRVRYGGVVRAYVEPAPNTRGLVSLDGRAAYFVTRGHPSYASAHATDGPVRLGEVDGVTEAVGRFGGRGAVFLGGAYGDVVVPYRVLDGATVVAAGELETPADGWAYARRRDYEGDRAVGAGGRRLVGVWEGALAGWEYGVWDLATGRLLPHGLDRIGEGRYLHGLTAGGRLVSSGLDAGSPDLRAHDLATGAEVWAVGLRRPFAARPALDLAAGRVLAPDGDGFLVLDAETGRVVRRLAPALDPAFVADRLALGGGWAVVCGSLDPAPYRPEVTCHVLDAASGARVRSVTGAPLGGVSEYRSEIAQVGASADAFALAWDRQLLVVPLASRWEVAAAD